MPIDQALSDKLDAIYRQWNDEDNPPDVMSGDMPDTGDAPEKPTVLPEMDFSQPEQPPATPAEPPIRLRAPSQSPSEPPPAAPPKPTTTGVGQQGSPGNPPAEPVGSLDWKGLAGRLRNAERSRGDSQAYESLFANVGAQSGYKPNVHAGDAEVANAKLPLEMAQAQQGYEKNALGLQAQKAAMGVASADKDPNSLQSQKARESIRSMGVKLPEGFDNWSAADVKRFINTGDLAHLEQIRATAENARRDDEAKRTAAAQKEAQTQKDLEGSRKAYAKELKALGVDPTTASQKDIDRAISIGHNKATEAVAASNNAIARAAEGRNASNYASLGQGIPFAGSELKYTGQGTPRPDDVDKAQGIASTYGAALSGMDDLSQKIDAFAKNPGPATKDAMASAARITGGHLNTAFGQGAMSQDEANAMSQVLGSDIKTAAGVQALYDKIMGDDEEAAKALGRRLKSARESTRAAALGKLKAYRFAPQGGESGGEKIRVRRKSDGTTGRLLPGDFDPNVYERL